MTSGLENNQEDIVIDYNMLMDDSIVDKFFLKTLKPSEVLMVSEWADKYRILSRTSSAEPGRWRTKRAPYLKEPMDCLSENHPCTEVVVMKGSQIGFSEAGFNWIGYIVDHAPGPVMMVMPTVDTAKRNVKMRLDPMIQETPQLKNKIGAKKAKDEDNTNTMKLFPGGVLIISGGNSAASLRSVPIKYLFLDEEDGYPLDLDGEGSPIELAKKRTKTFGSRKKVFRISTPVFEDSSTIAQAYQESNMKKYHVPCPHCDAMQEIEWKNIRWENNDPTTVRLQCVECEQDIEEHNKTMMLQEGEWIAGRPEVEIEGFHISSLYSPLGWYSWQEAVEDFISAKESEEKMKTFYNTTLGLTWKRRGDAPEWKKLFLRREQYKMGVVPKGVYFLTMAVDIQKDRIELEVVGWGKGKENWSVTHEIIEGDTSEDLVWGKLDYFIQKQWPVEDSEQDLPIKMTAIDSGYNSQRVYTFCRKYPRSRVIPVKGSATSQVPVQIPKAVDVRRNKAKYYKHGMRVWNVGVSLIKSEIYSSLKRDIPADGEATPVGWYHFPEYGEEYFKQLTAEQLTKKKNKKGYFIYEWVKTRDRNEALDLKVYNRAASIVLGIDRMTDADFESLIQNSPVVKTDKVGDNNNSNPKVKQRRKKKKSDFWD